MKTQFTYLTMSLIIILLASCSATRQTTSRVTGEWNIEKFESRTAGGSVSTIENAGEIIFRNNGRGEQTLVTSVTQGAMSTGTEFSWDNTEHTVSIETQNSSYPKVWIIVDSGRNSQQWYSTDSEGNVQVLHLRKK